MLFENHRILPALEKHTHTPHRFGAVCFPPFILLPRWREEMGGLISEAEVFSGSEENIEGQHPAQLNGFHNVSTLSSPG